MRARTIELDVLPDVCEGIEVWFPAPLSPEAAALMKTLGVVVHVNPARDEHGALLRHELEDAA